MSKQAKFVVDECVWVQPAGEYGYIQEVLPAETTYLYRVQLNNRHINGIGEMWLYKPCMHDTPCSFYGYKNWECENEQEVGKTNV